MKLFFVSVESLKATVLEEGARVPVGLGQGAGAGRDCLNVIISAEKSRYEEQDEGPPAGSPKCFFSFFPTT